MNNKKLVMVFIMLQLDLFGGCFRNIFFQYISYAGAIEVVLHRSFWTFIILFITTIYLKNGLLLNKFYLTKKIFILFITSILIFSNWATWIYAVSTERIIDASYGYFIFPIINIFLDLFSLKKN